ncbi:MAG TPA: hypothetical protein VGR73_19670 [Bryobacteraceae bacterium]|nr:hypothetical protein [Bryobacteraceae bacterium]
MIGSLIQDGMLALGLIASLSLFLALKWELQIEARKHQRALEEFAAKLRAATSAPPPALPPVSPPPAETSLLPPPPRSGLNLNRRVQAVRLLRRGGDIGHVCAVLDVPRREIELLVRVERLAAERSRAS